MSLISISLVALIITTALYGLSFLLSSHFSSDIEKYTAYECGFEPLGDARMKFDILYLIIALLYLIFDLELIFLFPYGAIIKDASFLNISILSFFLIVLTLAFIYEYNKGALNLIKNKV